MNLENKTVLVTGASSGIGQAIAVACAQKGAIVLINYRKNNKGAEETLREVEKYSKGFTFQADLVREQEIESMFSKIAGKCGTIDVLVNNAGDAEHSDFFDDALWRQQFENIFFSALHVSQSFLKQNTGSPLRKIVTISSCYGNPGGGSIQSFAYSVAKSALTAMTTLLAKVDARVLTNVVAPGYTWTPCWEGISEDEKRLCESRTKINRYVESPEIATMVVSILENDAMTGQVVTVDGGLSLQKLERNKVSFPSD